MLKGLLCGCFGCFDFFMTINRVNYRSALENASQYLGLHVVALKFSLLCMLSGLGS